MGAGLIVWGVEIGSPKVAEYPTSLPQYHQTQQHTQFFNPNPSLILLKSHQYLPKSQTMETPEELQMAAIRAPVVLLYQHLEVLQTQLYQYAVDIRKVQIALSVMIDHTGIWTIDEVVRTMRLEATIKRQGQAVHRQLEDLRRQLLTAESRFSFEIGERGLHEVISELCAGYPDRENGAARMRGEDEGGADVGGDDAGAGVNIVDDDEDSVAAHSSTKCSSQTVWSLRMSDSSDPFPNSTHIPYIRPMLHS
ncbi:hypothetical protein DFP73DRAFT_524694 [Morchella snyderi]|nr:hypothetical protein DFP73DRAFT_524694 [Morchella snyderi]